MTSASLPGATSACNLGLAKRRDAQLVKFTCVGDRTELFFGHHRPVLGNHR